MARRRARELAFRTLFQAERGADDLLAVWSGVRADLAEEPEDAGDDPYGDPLDRTAIALADSLLKAYAEDGERVDAVLEENITGWSFGQMSQTDLNVLRVAVTELLHLETPAPVVLEMAVRVAKRYGGDDSGRFVNGVLAKVVRSLRSAGRVPGAAREASNDGEADPEGGETGVFGAAGTEGRE
ncbi:MAG TPA: transcription antitermination factor NusB [Trueperaceae bacterium]|nr:transcription antitermination factor NusB [Trueperaceae bacterium]